MNGVTDAKAMMDKQDRKGGENNLGKKGKNNKLHKLASGCDSDYDGCGLTSMLQHTHTHKHTHTQGEHNVIVSDGQKSFQSGGDPVIPHRPGLRPRYPRDWGQTVPGGGSKKSRLQNVTKYMTLITTTNS